MKLSERAAQIFHSREHSCAENMVGALADALDEWQASVDKRLEALVEVVNEIQLRIISGEPSKYDEEPDPE